MRKFALLLAILFLGTTQLSAQVGTPYKYGHRWDFALMGGPVLFDSDYSDMFIGHYMSPSIFSLVGTAALGYNFTDGHGMRFLANYGRRHGLMPADFGFYPFTFSSVEVFGDYVLNYRGLGEYYTPFCPKMYVGPGMAYSYDFRTSWEPDEYPALDEYLSRSNVVPAFHFGMILEYNFKSGLGIITDIGLLFFMDTYDGLPFISFPVDLEISAMFGLVYHFKRPKKR